MLTLFISSVSREFDEARKDLTKEILSLQDMFLAMEFFGSDPRSPADYCRLLVQRSHLYIGLIGERLGSIEENTQCSFTEIEYRAAIDHHVPCLIYLSSHIFAEDRSIKQSIDERQKRFINQLRKDHICHPFHSIDELKLLFLKDFIKLLREGRFSPIIHLRPGPISPEVLHTLTKGLLPEQVKAVAQEKYIPEIYTPREAEHKIDEFIAFEHEFRNGTSIIGDQLSLAAQKYGLKDRATEPLLLLRKAIHEATTDQFDAILNRVKYAFFFDETMAFIKAINAIAEAPEDLDTGQRIYELAASICNAPFVSPQNPNELADELYKLKGPLASGYTTSVPYGNIMQSFPSAGKQTCVDLIQQLQLLMERYNRNCLVLVDKAGSGKTNIACHAAETLIHDHPVMLLSGQMELSDEYSIEIHVQKLLELHLAGIFSDWLNRISDGLKGKHQWFYIIIDGINENVNRNLFIRLLSNFLPRMKHRRIKLLLTCRDILWESFRDVIFPYSFRSPIAINNYTDKERRKAVALYFNKYKINCTLAAAAEKSLHDPLLLRFFCEANTGRQLGHVPHIRLVKIFDYYVVRLNSSLREKFATPSTDPFLRLLLEIANIMWRTKTVVIDQEILLSLPSFPQTKGLLYGSILGENIILEEQTHPYSLQRNVRFLYDEFMEYILARMLFENIHSGRVTLAATIQESLDAMETFPAAVGAILFLDQIMAPEDGVINMFIRSAFRLRKFSSQVQLLYAFDRMNLSQPDDELISALETFYSMIGKEYKDQLAFIISRALNYIPNHPFAKRYASEVLEVNPTLWARAAGGEKATHQKQRLSPKEREDDRIGLPPARYRYKQEAKLSAISLLIARGEEEDFDIIREGIQRIGRSDINTALKAMKALDQVEDNFLFFLLEEYTRTQLAEYRLFAAWLLRARYGQEPAKFLLILLLDKETRVHQYAFSLFSIRSIEPALIQGILSEIQKPALSSWYMVNFIQLLGKRNQYLQEQDQPAFIQPIISALKQLCQQQKAVIRLEAYRACISFPEYFDIQLLKTDMLRDEDNLIRRQASLLS